MPIKQNNRTHSKKIYLRRKILLFIFVLSMFPLFFVSKNVFVGLSQTVDKKEKKFSKETYKNEPVEFVELKSNGKKFKLNEKSSQESNWLKDFTIDFKNVSGKQITYVSILISFPETRSTGFPMSYFIKYGISPDVPNNNNDEPKLLGSGETAQVILSAKRYDTLTSFLATRNHTLTDLTEADLLIKSVSFADGTTWSAGAISRPDPNRPGKYIFVDENH